MDSDMLFKEKDLEKSTLDTEDVFIVYFLMGVGHNTAHLRPPTPAICICGDSPTRPSRPLNLQE